jgi:hypothetical protein
MCVFRLMDGDYGDDAFFLKACSNIVRMISFTSIGCTDGRFLIIYPVYIMTKTILLWAYPFL